VGWVFDEDGLGCAVAVILLHYVYGSGNRNASVNSLLTGTNVFSMIGKRMMGFKKLFLVLLLPLFFASFVLPQSLVELSKKEKARRAKIKAEKRTVVTNAVLAKMKAKPAVANQTLPFPEEQIAPSLKSGEHQQDKDQDASAKVKSEDTNPVDEPTIEELEQTWKKAEEYASLLSLKMRALLQEFYSMDDMASKENIKKQMSETSQKLEKAQEDADKAKKEYDLAIARIKKKKRFI
jgi:hypothetical protein